MLLEVIRREKRCNGNSSLNNGKLNIRQSPFLFLLLFNFFTLSLSHTPFSFHIAANPGVLQTIIIESSAFQKHHVEEMVAYGAIVGIRIRRREKIKLQRTIINITVSWIEFFPAYFSHVA